MVTSSARALTCWVLLAAAAAAQVADLGVYRDALGDDTAALVAAVKTADEIDLGRRSWTFEELPWDDREFAQAASKVRLFGHNREWVWQQREEGRIEPATLVRLDLPPGVAWWRQTTPKAGPAVFERIAFEFRDATVFQFGDFASAEPFGYDARGNAIRYCSFHGQTMHAGPYAVRGIRQYNFEIDHCSFRGASGIELSGDMPTLSHLRMGWHQVAIRTFDVAGHAHVPGTISDVEIEGAAITGIVTAGDNLHRVSVETGYGDTPTSDLRCPGRVVRWGERYAVLTEDGWLSDDDKCPAFAVDGPGELVHKVPAVLGGEGLTVDQCRFALNRSLDAPQFVIVPGRSPQRVYGVPEPWGMERETKCRPVVSAWCAGVQHKLYGQVLTDHLLLDHPLVNSRQPFDPNWGAHGVGAANNEAQQLLYRQRDGRWVYRLSDSRTGWTRRDGGKLAVWADRDGCELVHWDGQRQTRTRLREGWQSVSFLPGRIQGDGVEVELPQ